MKSLVAKVLMSSLGDEYKVKNFKGHYTIFRVIDENTVVKITNISKYNPYVNVCLSVKGECGCDLVNYIRMNIPYSDILGVVDELLKNANKKEAVNED